MGGALIQHKELVNCFDVLERTVKSDTDNIAKMYWSLKGSAASKSATAYLLRIQALHQRHHRYVTLRDYLLGKQNNMADDASRLTHMDDRTFLTHFNSVYPQTKSWQLWQQPERISFLPDYSLAQEEFRSQRRFFASLRR